VSMLIGRTVRVVEAPLDAVVSTMTSFGMSTNFAQLYRELYGCIVSGSFKWESGKDPVRGKTTLAEALRPLMGA
jgi:hypothetical protein